MPSVHEILLEVLANSDQATSELGDVRRSLAEFAATDAEAHINLSGVRQAQVELAELRRELESVDRERVSPKVGLSIDDALAELTTLERDLTSFFNREARRRGTLGLIDQEKELANVRAFIARAQGLFAGLERAGGAVQIPIDLGGVEAVDARIAELHQRLRELEHEDVEPSVRVNVASALIQLELVKRKLNEVKREGAGGFVEAGLMQGLFAAFSGAEKAAEGAITAVESTVQAAEEAGGALTKVGGLLATAFGGDKAGLIGVVAGKTRDFQEVGQLVVIMLIGGLIPAIAALVASLSAAIIGAGGLAAAFAAALGPAVALLIALFTRFAAILAARKALQQQDTKSTQDGAKAARAAAQAEEQRHAAVTALRDAQQGAVSAERALGEARRQAGEAIANAADAEQAAQRAVGDALRAVGDADRAITEARLEARRKIADAVNAERTAHERLADAIRAAAQQEDDSTRRLTDAQDALREATTGAYRAWQDSIEAVTDAQLRLEDAILGVAEAQLSLEEAQARVNDLLRATPALAQQVFQVLQKLQDVDLGPDALAGLTQQIGTVGGSNPSKDALELRRALLQLARARLGVKESIDRQGDSQRDLNDAETTAARFTREGIAAFEPYRQAIRGVADAQRNLANVQREGARAIRDASRNFRDAAREVGELRRQTVEGAPAVRQALERERDARARLAEARRREADAEETLARLRNQGVDRAPAVLNAENALRDAHERVLEAKRKLQTSGATFGELPADAAQAEQALSKLDATERGFLATLMGSLGQVQSIMQPATDAILSALGSVLQGLGRVAGPLRGLFQGIGIVWANSIRSAGRSLLQPAWREAVKTIFAGTVVLSKPVADSFGSLMVILRNIAVAVLPLLVPLMQALAAALGRFADKTSDIEGLRDFFKPMVDATRAWLGLIGQLINFFVQFGAAVGPIGTALVGWLTEGLKQLNGWLASGRGRRDLQQFFKDVLPFARELVTVIGQFAVFLFRAFQIVAPIMTPALQLFGALLRVVNGVLGVFVALVSPIFQTIGLLGQLGPTFSLIADGARLLQIVLGGVADAIRIVFFLFAGVVGAILSPFKKAVAALRSFLGVASPSRLFLQIGRDVVQGFVLGILRLAGAPVAALLSIGRRGIAGLRRFVSQAGGVGASVARSFATGALRVLGFIGNVARRLGRAFTSGFSTVGRTLSAIFRGALNGVISVINGAIGAINFIIRRVNSLPTVNTPFGSVGFPNIGEIGKIARLGAGGIVGSRLLAELGEAGNKEAVLPLTSAVFGELGAAIASATGLAQRKLALSSPSLSGARDNVRGEMHQHFHIPTPPAGRSVEPRVTAALLAREMAKRAPVPA